MNLLNPLTTGSFGPAQKRCLRYVVFALTFHLCILSSKAQIVIKDLYLSDPSQALDRIDPVATADATTASSPTFSMTSAGIAVANTSSGFSFNPGTTSFSVAHTTGTGDNRLMLVGISTKNRLVNSVTYGGVPLTLVGESVSNTQAHMHIYRLINPASGTANVVVNLNGIPDKGIVVGVTTFTGVDQLAPLGTFTSAQGGTNTASTTVSSAAGQLVYDVATFKNLSSITPAAGQTALYNVNTGNEIDGGVGSTKPGAASVTMTWNTTGNGNTAWAIGAVPIRPASSILFTAFTQAPVLCSPLTIKAGNTITITNYVSIVSGTMPANPAITADLKYGANTILTLASPTYNSGTGILTWTGTLGADLTIPAGQAIRLEITMSQPGVSFRIDFDSQTKPSKISLPVSTYIYVNSVDVYSAPYPGGIPVNTSLGGTTKYLRAVVSDPFGFNDITALDFTISPGSTVAGTSVGTSGCTKTFQYVWSIPIPTQTYSITGVAKEGYENTVTHSNSTSIAVSLSAPPSAINDSASGPGGEPITIDVLANDSDPNNNMNNASLSIVTQPSNGTVLINNGNLVYVPNGTFAGRDTITYRICDLSIPTPLCATAKVFLTIDPTIIDACLQASRTHTYFIPYAEQHAYTALVASSSYAITSNTLRTVISLKVPYPGMTVVWDEWEDGYEANFLSPTQSTTKVWGDGNIFNGIAPGYPADLIPAGGSIVLDNTMTANPRNPSNIYYDGKDKIVSSGQITMTQVTGDPTLISVQAMKTNITSTYDFGQSFTIPFGQDFPSRDFAYTSLFIRASQNNTVVNIDKDNNGTFEITTTLNEGNSYHVNGGVLTGALITSDKPIGVEIAAGGIDMWSIRNSPVFPATWYSNIYYTPVPTSDSASSPLKDTSVVMFYNSLNRAITINWYNGIPGAGSFSIPAKTAYRFPLAYSTTAAYKFENLTGESFTAIQIMDSYTPGGGGNEGASYDWSINLISHSRLTDYATIAWAPGSIDGTRNDNPIWVTPAANTTIYVKYNGDVLNGGSVSPCGLRYDVSYPLNALNHRKVLDPNDNDQGGIAIYTCDGVKLAAVYGEDAATAVVGGPSWDVGSTIQPFCKDKMLFANDDYAETPISQPVTISILNNDFGFQAVLDPASVNMIGLLQPANGTVSINPNGTVVYTPNAGYTGFDYFQYQVCSTPAIKCDIALVTVKIAACPAGSNVNLITGTVFLDITKDGINNDGGNVLYPAKVYLYMDANCNGAINPGELVDSVSVDSSGTYQFRRNAEKTVSDDFNTGSTSTCASGSDGNTPWLTNWVDAGEGGSTGFCVTPAQSANNTDAEIILDGAFSHALRLDDNNVSATRTLNLSGMTKGFLSFSYRRATSLSTNEEVYVQMSTNGSTFSTIFTITPGAADAAYIRVYNQDISAYTGATTYLRFLTSNWVDEGDYIFIDDITFTFLKYNQCYITQFNTSYIPTDYSLTTPSQYAITFTGAGTCSIARDFGIAKPSITISGRVHNDATALTDGNVNGSPTGSPSGTALYAYLVSPAGKVQHKVVVTSGTGVFSFPLADIKTTYTLKISTLNVAQFADEPTTVALPGTWESVGEEYGSGNSAGTGVEPGTPNSAVPVTTTTSDVTNVRIGIQRPPNSDSYITPILSPSLNQYITLNGGTNPPILSGTDPEDCSSGCQLTSKSLIIDAYPVNAELYYNNILVYDGQMISNFNPSLLQLKMTAATIGDTMVTFLYSYVDIGARQDSTPATYTLYWPTPLPATGLILSAKLNDNLTNLSWVTFSEQNTSHFVVERSVDNTNWSIIAPRIAAAGESVTDMHYGYQDNIESVSHYPVIYYRIKLVDIDARISYTNIVAIKPPTNIEVTVKPNPFKSFLAINVSSKRATSAIIRLTDMTGRSMRVMRKNLSRGINSFEISNLEHLAPGVYTLYVTDENNETKNVTKVVKVY